MLASSFKNIGLTWKIILISVISTSMSLLLVCFMFISYERYEFRQNLSGEMTNLAQSLAQRSMSALALNDRKTSRQLFNSLVDNPDVLQAVLYDQYGNLLSQYLNSRYPGDLRIPLPQADAILSSGNSMKVFHVIQSQGQILGTLYVEADMSEMQSRLAGYMTVTVIAWLLSLLVTFLVAGRLQGYVVNPLRQVVARMQEIAGGEADLTKRLEVQGGDELGEVAEAFNAFTEKLKTVAEMKLDLISVVSHQLKTPVAEINGFIENMLEGLTGDLNPRQKSYLISMRDIGRDNYQMISGLLSVSKIDRGVVTAQLGPVSAQVLVELSIRDYTQNLQEKGLRLDLEVEEGLTFLADQDKTLEALRNILNNAVKCTDQGSITIRAGREGELGVIEVIDTGIGMSPETLGRLFTKSRVMGLEAHRSGAGIGLYIAKHFMNIQQGDITAASELGKGSRFRLTLPLFKPVGLSVVPDLKTERAWNPRNRRLAEPS
jgi:histidine kinase